MITWITVWVLTVSYVNVENRGSVGYAAAHSYQLEYKDRNTCLKQAEAHRERKVTKTRILQPDTYVNKNKSTRCDFKQIPVVLEKSK